MKKTVLQSTILFFAVLTVSCSLTGYTEPEAVEISIDLDSRAPSAPYTWQSLSVTGSGMEDITFNASQIASLLELNNNQMIFPVPSGAARTFSITAATSSVTFTGSATVDIVAGTAPTIVLPMEVSDIEIIIPDRGYNGRLVQIDQVGPGAARINSASFFDFLQNEDQMLADIGYDSNGNIYGGVSTFTPGGYIYKTAAVDTLAESWDTVFVTEAGRLDHFAIRPDDGTLFTVQYNAGDSLIPYTANSLGQYITSGPAAQLDYNSSSLGLVRVGLIIDIELLDNGQLAVFGNYTSATQEDRVAVFIMDYNSGTETWTIVDTLGSDTATGLGDIFTFSGETLFTHKGNTIYFAGVSSPGNLELHEIQYDPSAIPPAPALSYDPADTVTYTGGNYILMNVITTLDDSLIFAVGNNNTETYEVLRFATVSDLDSTNPSAIPPDIYDGGGTPFNFSDAFY